MREAEVEAHLVDDANKNHGRAMKFASPGRRSVPDRIVLMPVPEHHRDIVARYVRFVECKATGEHSTKPQLREQKRLAALGFRVHEVDDPVDGYDLIQEMRRG